MAAAAAGLALTLAGCGVVSAFPQPQSLPGDLFTASRQSDAAPAGFHDDVERTSCGDVRLGQGELLPSDAASCMNAAIGATNAELAVITPTTEGDPIVTFYRTSADSPGFELYVNGSYDRYGAGEWAHLTCPSTDISVLNGCVEDAS